MLCFFEKEQKKSGYDMSDVVILYKKESDVNICSIFIRTYALCAQHCFLVCM